MGGGELIESTLVVVVLGWRSFQRFPHDPGERPPTSDRAVS
jgi:hypothetical protein